MGQKKYLEIVLYLYLFIMNNHFPTIHKDKNILMEFFCFVQKWF